MTLFLHIGIPKTGTTSLQVFLEENRDALLARGVAVARAPHSRNHRALAMHALEDNRVDNSRRAKGLTTPAAVAAFRRNLEARIAEEAAALPPVPALVFTSEQLTRLHRDSEMERLKALLAPYGRPIKVVAYVRRQDEYYASAYSQMVKGGQSFEPGDRTVLQAGLAQDYEALLAPWARAFGDAAILVRPFERASMPGGDIVADFAQVIGLQRHEDLPRPKAMNQSLDLATLEFLRRLNPHVPRWGEAGQNPRRPRIIAALEAISGPERMRLSREEAEALMARFEASNAAVARRFLGREDGVLFRETPADRPAARAALTLDEAMAITGRLLGELL